MVWAAALWTAIGAGVGLLLAVSVPHLLGGQALTVMSGSMEPVLRPGDIVVNKRISPLDARVGDVITFRSPDGSSRMITHRVRSMHVSDGSVHFVTKGDAASGTDRWSMPTDASLGRARYRIRKLGYALFWIRSSYSRPGLIELSAVLLGAVGLVRIWRPRPGSPR